MTGRLLKFELKSCIKFPAILWGAALISSFIFGMVSRLIRVSGDGNGPGTLLTLTEVTFGLIFAATLMALLVGTLIIIVLRFYKGLLDEEGYMMHTLPVKTWQLITSKGMAAGILMTISYLVTILSVLVVILIMGSYVWEAVDNVLKFIVHNPSVLILAFEVLVICVESLLVGIYTLYASMSIGQLVGKHRILLSVGTYMGIRTVLGTLGALIEILALETNMFDILVKPFENIPADAGFIRYVLAAQPDIILVFVIFAIPLAGFHIITERLLATKLNLQ